MKKTMNKITARLIAVGLMASMLVSAVSCNEKTVSADDFQPAEKAVTQEVEETQKSETTLDSKFNVTVENLLPTKEEGASTSTASQVYMIDVPILAEDIEAGSKITTSKVTTKKMRSDAVSISMITSVDEVVGSYTTVKLYKGDFVYKGKISPRRVDNIVSADGVEKTKMKYIDVSQFVEPNTGKDLYEVLQALITNNPKRTLYFPDGEYIISKTLQASGAAAQSTSFYLSDNAVIKASDTWRSTTAPLIRFGEGNTGTENNITVPGSNYSFIGGILDGNRKARGIEFAGGRETLVSKVKIINATVGIYIAEGINSGSSDMDIEDIDIIGYGLNSVGMLIEAYDNNLVDIRISNVAVGVDSINGNFFRGVSVRCDITPESSTWYESTVGFRISGNNWFYSCSSENMATAFEFTSSTEMIVKDFSIRWTKAQGSQTAFKATKSFGAICSNGIIDFFDETTDNAILDASSVTVGKFLDVIADTELCDETFYESVFFTSKVGEQGGQDDE